MKAERRGVKLGKKESLIYRLIDEKCICNSDNEAEQKIVELINKTPYELLSAQQKQILLANDYEPGTFYISERNENTDFLFDEPKQSFYEWFSNVVSGEIRQLKKNSNFDKLLQEYGVQQLIEDVYTILFFNTYEERMFCELIPNQEYSDVFRRIILFLLCDDPNYEINTYLEFNAMGYHLIPKVLEKGDYSLKQRLIQSIYSGLIGMDIKDELAATSPLSREKIIALSGNESEEEKQNEIFNRLDQAVTLGKIDVSSWESFENNIINNDRDLFLCWFTDDYIPTMFEMKFMEELLISNSKINITIIPRFQSYSNDASWKDVETFLTLPVFKYLSDLTDEGRFSVCRAGMAGGAFNGKRMSSECAAIVSKCDYVVISGARSYEMGQGILKPTFFTGIAVCRTYSETVTGICKNDGGIVFLEQLSGDKSFSGFRKRSCMKKYCSIHNRWYPVAKKTALDYLKK